MNSPVEGIILRITHTICLKVYTYADDSNRQVMVGEKCLMKYTTLWNICVREAASNAY